jgi:curved DNA-binding protein CbpA
MAKTHYETLGVGKQATHEEIKKVFRKLSLETHPDLNKGKANIERFKQISEAYNIVGNEKARRRYDFELSSDFFGSLRSDAPGTSAHYSGRRPTHYGRKPENGMHHVMETIYRPRNFLLFTVGVCAYMAASTFFAKKPDFSDEGSVEAWKNPRTNQWETPAPWDPVYQKLQPTLQNIPRSQVKDSSR